MTPQDPVPAAGPVDSLGDQWTVSGRLALSNGRDGGSGTLTWSQDGERGELVFVGAFGRGGWRLTTGPELAVLQTADGQVHHAENVADLVQQQTGWQVPVDALRYWIRGLPQPQSEVRLERRRDGRLSALQQHGWLVRFDGVLQTAPGNPPRKITADRNGHRVRLLVTSWSVDSPA